MADIIEFKAYRIPNGKNIDSNSNKHRIRALSEGRIRTFSCDDCGEEFEVYYDEFPDRCPGCNRIFDWERSRINE